MAYTVALAGNPNSGKTTLFNNLTKLRQSVGNWSGVTVEKKEGYYHADKEIKLIDLPGVYSLSPFTAEEKVTREYIIKEKPDLIINVVDVTKLERNLYLTGEILETGVKTVIAMNMADELEGGVSLNIENFEKASGCAAVLISALKNLQIDTLMQKVKSLLTEKTPPSFPEYLAKTEKKISFAEKKYNLTRFQAVKLLERDALILRELNSKGVSVDENLLPKEGEIAEERYQAAEKWAKNTVIRQKKSLTDRLDSIILNKYLAFPIFFAAIFLMYYLAIQKAGVLGYKYVEEGFNLLAEKTRDILSRSFSGAFISLICDGIIKGVGAVLAFLPQVTVLYFILALLEGSGYMARAAVITDRIFKGLGLSGKAFIPMIIGSGCSVPAVMAARTVDNLTQRQKTILIIPFVPCSAKLPLFALLGGTFFPDNPIIAPLLYFIGILTAAFTCLLLKWLKEDKDDFGFILELPKYRIPSFSGVMKELWHKTKGFLIKAGTIIFVASACIWLLQRFNWRFQEVSPEYSLLATIGKVISPLFIPLGFSDWRISVALLCGMAAKENIVSSLAVLFPEGVLIAFSAQAAFVFMVFVLLSTPCVAAVAAMQKEMGSNKKWLLAIFYQTLIAYIAALVFRLGFSFYGASQTAFWIALIALTVAIITVILIKKKKSSQNGGKNAYRCRNRKTGENGKNRYYRKKVGTDRGRNPSFWPLQGENRRVR